MAEVAQDDATLDQEDQQLVSSDKNFGENSYFKLWVVFIDGNKRHFYSRDKKNSRKQPDPEVGLDRLRKYINKKLMRMNVYMIYDKRNGGDVILTHYSHGKLIVNNSI